MIQQSDVTIIIPHLGETKQQLDSLGECLLSLHDSYPEIKVIVVKNGTIPYGNEDDLNPEYKVQSNQFLMCIEEQGQCKAVNAAAATVSTPWIMVSNDDMMYAPGWFDRLTSEIDKDGFLRVKTGDIPTKTLCISPILIEPQDGAPTFEKYFCGGAGGDFDKTKWLGFAKNRELVDQPLRTGFNLPFLIKKELWDLVGGYDVNYDPWSSNSDSDLEYKIKLAGIQPIQNKNCAVYHFSQTSGTFEPKNRPSWEKNWQYFIDKWGFPRTDDGIWQASFSIPTPDEGRIFRPWWEGFYE
jgi:hypothetical protein